MTDAITFQTKVDKQILNMDRFDQIINGDVTTTVTIDGGAPVPSLRKMVADNLATVYEDTRGPPGISTPDLSLAGASGAVQDTDLLWIMRGGVAKKAVGTQFIRPAANGETFIPGGLRLAGAATLAAADNAVFSYNAPVGRYIIGDGTGYSFRFSKRVGSVTTDLLAITDDGSTGIGTATPRSKLTVIPATDPTSNTGVMQVEIGEQSNNTQYGMRLGFVFANAAWAAVIDSRAGGAGAGLLLNPSGGNVGIGTAIPGAKLHVVGTEALRLQATSPFFTFFDLSSTRLGYMQAISGHIQIVNEVAGGDVIISVVGSGRSLRSNSDNITQLGLSSNRWAVVYAGTGSINTSDEREKQQITAFSDALLDAWGSVDWCSFKFNDAVAEKGVAARWHFGAIAQQVRDVLTGAGFDALSLGLLCYDEWSAESAVEAVDGVQEVRDEEGNIVVEAVEAVNAQPGREAGNRWGLRYDECQAIEAAYQRRRFDRIEARLAALEAA